MKVGDRLIIGSAEFVVTQPRLPCFKLGIRLGDPGAIKTLLQSRKTGFYLEVAKEGAITAGDAIQLIESNHSGLSVSDIVDLYAGAVTEAQKLQAAIDSPALPMSWRDHFRKRLAGR
jgi:MOSC domain-containing protein YiiM